MRQVRVSARLRGIRALMLLTAAVAMGCSLQIGLKNFLKSQKRYMAMANYHAARAAFYRSSIPKAQGDLENERCKRHAKITVILAEDDPIIVNYKQQIEFNVAHHKKRLVDYAKLVEYHDKMRAKYANAAKWPLPAPPPDPREPPDPDFGF